MPNYTAKTSITTGRGDTLSATKSGNYTDTFNTRQAVDSSTSFIPLIAGGASKGTATLDDAKSVIIKNSGVVGAEIQIKIYARTNATPDGIGSIDYLHYMLGAGEYIYLPNIRQFTFNVDASGGDAYTLNNQAPHSNMYVALDNAAAGDPQLLNGTELASGTTATAVTVDEAAYLFVGDIIRLENEICEITSISGNEITIIRGTHGSTAATHADDVAIRMPFFNAYHNFTAATGGYDTVQTDSKGRFKAMNFFGYARNTDGSGNRLSNGLVAGSISGKFYTSGYQGLGLKNITSSTNSGLTAGETLKLDITVDGGTKFQDLTFTLDSSNVNFGGNNGVISKIQSALDVKYYTAGNLFQKRVTVGIVDGDIRFTSGSHLSTSAILLEDTGDSDTFIDAAANGRIPPAAKLANPVAAALSPDTVLDRRTGTERPNLSSMFYDDGFGNITGACSGNISYATGAITLHNAPADAHFVVSANYGSAHSGGNLFSSNDANSITSIAARSMNTKINTVVEIIGLN